MLELVELEVLLVAYFIFIKVVDVQESFILVASFDFKKDCFLLKAVLKLVTLYSFLALQESLRMARVALVLLVKFCSN